MYQRTENQMNLPVDFFLPFGGKLAEDNRWVLLAQMIPWWMLEEKYAKNFKKSLKGQKAVSIRIALGALIIQERLAPMIGRHFVRFWRTRICSTSSVCRNIGTAVRFIILS
ncbi:hypothetical protein PPOLYM_03863 [Paenibacillus polymyxa]|nr:hypothetical protein A7309_11205 [Paenibacillus polymyxa]VUG07454.1 hypothetical protein PPOLYM_03863 [Paenibacillus polymyxa]